MWHLGFSQVVCQDTSKRTPCLGFPARPPSELDSWHCKEAAGRPSMAAAVLQHLLQQDLPKAENCNVWDIFKRLQCGQGKILSGYGGS